MKEEKMWHLERDEEELLHFGGTITSIKVKFREYRNNTRITFTTKRIICEQYSKIGRIDLTVVFHYIDLVAIRTNSELGDHGITLTDCNSDLVWFNFFRKNLRGTQIFLQYFSCVYATNKENPSTVLEKLRKIHVESTIPGDLFNADVPYNERFKDLLNHWGVVLREDKVPQIASSASAYNTPEYPRASDARSDKQYSEKSAERYGLSNAIELYKITEVLANQESMVYKGQAILRATNSRTISTKNVHSRDTGYLEIKEIDFNHHYSLNEIESLYIIRVGMKNAQEEMSPDKRNDKNHQDQSFSPSTTQLLEKFDSLIGLTQAKAKVREIVAIAETNQQRKKYNLDITNISQHMIFSGNPGTGKTTIARKLGEIFKEIGILSKGHFVEVQRSDLVAEYLGQTAIKTSAIIQKALGGILFIDEAYSLTPGIGIDQFGNEAINTLVAALENHRNDFVVIAAGYPEEMKTFANSNPGLNSRFSTTVNFEDYTNLELVEIFKRITLEANMKLGEGVEAILKDIIDLICSKRGKGFGNAREVRKTFERVLATQSQRLNGTNAGLNELQTILPEDLLATKSKMFPRTEGKEVDIDHELNELIGLSGVKEEIKGLIDTSRNNAKRKEKGLRSVQTSLHMVFAGNPGTGKTTVARLVARYLFEIGCLSRDHLVEVSRADLVAGFVGQTAIKTMNKLEYALGGVLFIDEAYTLYDRFDQYNYGKESLETILKFMEDHKENIVVILAGYRSEMDTLINSNPGLRSRFNRFIHFDDYEPLELLLVFKKIAESSDYTTSKNFDEELLASIELLLLNKKSTFGNGRAMRNLFEKVIERQASRLSCSSDQTLGELRELTIHDLNQNDLISTMV